MVKRAIMTLAIFAVTAVPGVCLAQSPPQTYLGKDGAEMVYIPEGSFIMGSAESDLQEISPKHKVYTDAFYMDRFEVTNKLYARFLDNVKPSEGNSGDRSRWVVLRSDLEDPTKIDWWPTEIVLNNERYKPFEGYENLPVITVSWIGAKAYCEWAGKRLPTEAEWEKAARGGLEEKAYPWGNEIPTGGVVYDRAWRDNQRPAPTNSVGNYHSNAYGLFDMAGNVSEWCQDWYDPSYYKDSKRDNPQGPDSGTQKVLRGGSWYNNAYFLRVALRNFSDPASQNDAVGFRCVKDAKQMQNK